MLENQYIYKTDFLIGGDVYYQIIARSCVSENSSFMLEFFFIYKINNPIADSWTTINRFKASVASADDQPNVLYPKNKITPHTINKTWKFVTTCAPWNQIKKKEM